MKAAIRQHYGLAGVTHQINWSDATKQRSGESVSNYTARTLEELSAHLAETKSLIHGKDRVPTAQGSLTTLLDQIHAKYGAQTEEQPFSRLALGIMGKNYRRAQDAFDLQAQDIRVDKVQTNLLALLFSEMSVQGLANSAIRNMVIQMTEKLHGDMFFPKEFDQENPTIASPLALLTDKMTQIEQQIGRSNGNGASVHSMATDKPVMNNPVHHQQDISENTGTSSASVDAAAAAKKKAKADKKKQKARDKKNGQNGGRVHATESSDKSCTFCQLTGHIAAECFKKKTCEKFGYAPKGGAHAVDVQHAGTSGNDRWQ
jgi:hypothetical protein